MSELFDEGVRILLVEDDDDDVELLGWALRRPGRPFALARVAGLDAALTACAAGGFDVVLLDLGLPGMHGMEAVASISGTAGAPPVIVLTGLDDPATEQQALAAGAAAYLVKTNDAEHIFAVIQRALGLDREP